jgi:MYXO-CTERM domain-containing protein
MNQPRKLQALARATATLALPLASLLAAGSAQARPENPGKLQSALNLGCTPYCLLCHTVPQGGGEYLRTPFGNVLEGALLSSDPKTSLEALNTTDTDGDGMFDIDEIKALRDPSIPGDASICIASYGCGARVAGKPPQPTNNGWLFVIGAAALGVLRFRFGRQSTR